MGKNNGKTMENGDVASGKCLHNYGSFAIFSGRLTMTMAIFNSYAGHYHFGYYRCIELIWGLHNNLFRGSELNRRIFGFSDTDDTIFVVS